MNPLSGWENFYVIVGSSAGALIGLQFVVMTLLSESTLHNDVERASSAFATPTIFHFGAVLLVSAVMSAPWQGMLGPAVAIGILGLAGMFYTLIVARRMRTQTAYAPVFEDRLFHALLPFVAYAAVAASGFAANWSGAALFAVAAAVLLL